MIQALQFKQHGTGDLRFIIITQKLQGGQRRLYFMNPLFNIFPIFPSLPFHGGYLLQHGFSRHGQKPVIHTVIGPVRFSRHLRYQILLLQPFRQGQQLIQLLFSETEIHKQPAG